ncbi:peroxidase P7-like [Phoenix dactylifera]|uniref:Peroxidase n=1 Tax=Phoenix dactylifera TaxID=42345 RepID=A0A8B7C1Y3_PHODC|nr:peroxidase P7-like [Phoenix dactylifera]
MAFSKILVPLFLLSFLASAAHGQLSPTFYSRTCPNLERIVNIMMFRAVRREPRLGASILRLFFHDCFVNGCDASVLLDDTPTFTGEKNAGPNRNSLRGYEVIDAIKSQVERVCRATVSCADILALAARAGVVFHGGPKYVVPLGRRDARTASQFAANSNLPPASAGVNTLISMFAAKGLSAQDMTALSGAHSIGFARCSSYRPHIYNDFSVDPAYAAARKQTCPAVGGDNNLGPLNIQNPNRFGNTFFQNLVARRALLHSDQALFSNGPTDALVQRYSTNNALFFNDFAAAMVKMGNISPLTGFNGEIRLNCRRTN